LAFQAALRARAQARPRTIVFAEGDEPRTIEVVSEIIHERLLRPVLLGEPDAVKDALAAAGCDPTSVSVVDPSSDTDRYALELLELRRSSALARDQAQARARDPLFRAALMVRRGEADGSVAGAVHTTREVLRAALVCVGPAAGIRTVSSSFYMVVQDFRGRGEEVISFTDAGVVPEPTPQQLSDIAFAAVRARALVVGDEPRVAFLSYSTRGSAYGAGVDRVVEGLRLFRDRAPDIPSDGELQGDAALVEAVARRKAPDSAVAGLANILVFPDLGAANIAYKLVERLGAAAAVGPIIQGLAKPLNDVSRGASAEAIVEVACVTALMAE
jgi:phosphate acetyltransferase